MKTFEDFANNFKKISLAQVAKLIVLSFYFVLIVTCGKNNVPTDPINNENESGSITNQTNS